MAADTYKDVPRLLCEHLAQYGGTFAPYAWAMNAAGYVSPVIDSRPRWHAIPAAFYPGVGTLFEPSNDQRYDK